MTPQAFLAELEGGGIRLLRDGDGLVATVLPGCSVEPYRAQIDAMKSSLTAELLKVEIIATVNVEPAQFDRLAYERLVALWEHHDALSASERYIVGLELCGGQDSASHRPGKELAS